MGATKLLRDYGPVQMGDRLGLAQFQTERALKAGLIPPADCKQGRWSAAVVDEAAARVEEIRTAVGSVPDVGAGRAAEVLTERLGIDVDADTVVELSEKGLLPVVGDYKGWPLYCGRTLERFDDRAALEHATSQGALFTTAQAAERMRLRRSDFDHLVRAGLLTPAMYGKSVFQRRRDVPNVALYRAGDIDAVLGRDDIDWDAARSTPRGFRSPLAKLPTAREDAERD